MRRPPSIIDRRSVASARAPLATLRPLGTPSGYTRRNRLGGSTWWRPGRAAAGGHACLGEDPMGIGRHGGAPPTPPAAGCPWRTPRGTLWGGRLVVCRRERRGAACEGRQSRATWSAGDGQAGQPQAVMPVSGRTRWASVGMGARPQPPQRQGAHGGHHAEPSGAGGWLSAGANEGGRRAKGGNRGGRGQRARRRRSRAATWSASWGVSQ